ncbi:MAG: NADH-quinone oxidoreductase subunit N [Chitinophagales bacterium]|nr:NADH-quinone oxidoreductase subunit N [Chitinophagales bacterium]MDW8419641.1 NADH-quinone oxidoreductase subunit N [Chitinophagales bacterium]
MKTLIYTSALAFLCMIAEIFHLRRYIIPAAALGLGAIFVLNAGDWGISQSHYTNMMVTDRFSVAFAGLFLIIGLMITLLSGPFYKGEENKISDYISVKLFAITGAVAMVSFGNLAMFYLGIEVLSISLYILAGSRRRELRSNEAGMKYFLMGSFASALLLFGIALIYAETGTFDIYQIADFTTNSTLSRLFYTGAGLILVAFLFKVSAAPFHFWAPDVYEGSPTLTTALMATLSKLAAFAAFYKLFSNCLLPAIPVYAWVLSAVAALTLAISNFSALQQDSFKRMLAYSGISHAGYLLLAILSLYGKTDNAVFYYAVAYTFASIAAFAILIVVTANTGSEKIDAFNGLGKRKPLLAAALTIAMLSMAGIPPFAGFFAKYYVFSEAIRNGHLYITLFAVFASVVSVYYYFKVITAMYMAEAAEPVFTVKPIYAIVVGISIALTLILGLFPDTVSFL